MAEHTQPTARPEPVAVAAAVQAALAALVTLGWLNLDDTTTAAIGTVVAALVAAIVTARARAQVTPVADPTDTDGTPLVPANSAAAEVLTGVPVAELLARHRLREPEPPEGKT